MASSDLNPTLTNMSSGAEALSTLQEESFDLVLLDYSLPGQDGLELLPQIIEMGCAVIMITGKGNEEVAVEAMKRGAVDYLVKSPETFDLLPTIIERSLKAIQAEKALHESEERFRLLLDSTGEAIYDLDLEGNCTFCNPACLRLLGYGEVSDLLGKNMHELMHHTRPDGTLYPEEECRISQAFRQGEGTHVDDEVLWRAAGTSFPAEYRSFPIRRDGELIGSVVTFVDITERVQAEEELWATHEGLKKAYEELGRAQEQLVRSEKLAAVGKLTAGVSHEILNPLNIITLSLQLMVGDRETPPEIVEQLRVLEDQAGRIAKITQSLLYFSRQREPERRRLDLGEIVTQTLGLLERELMLENIDLDLKLAEKLPPVSADQYQLQQVVLNLLTNARDAMPKGGRLSLSIEAVQTDGKKFVELRVEDTGEGIAPEHLGKLFDPFFTTKDEGEGTGLGLSICQGIVETHGGSIRAESEEGRGSTFVVQLPLESTPEIEPS